MTINGGFFRGGDAVSQAPLSGAPSLTVIDVGLGDFSVVNINGGVFRKGDTPNVAAEQSRDYSIAVLGASELNLRGGDLEDLLASNGARVNIYGESFVVEGVYLDFTGRASVTLDQAHAGIAVDFLGQGFSEFSVTRENTAAIHLILVPEPTTTLIVFAAALVGMRRSRRQAGER